MVGIGVSACMVLDACVLLPSLFLASSQFQFQVLNSSKLQRICFLQKHGSHSVCLAVRRHSKGQKRDVSL